ncbi:MAG TPA: hypothetical protein VGD40_01350 [Chryseosolibacter sp.]
MQDFSALAAGLITFVGIGALPVYCLLRLLGINGRALALITVGYAPVSLAVFNTVNVLAGIQSTILQYIIPALLLALLGVMLKRRSIQFFEKNQERAVEKTFLFGLIFGFAYWLLAFTSTFGEGVSLNFDVVWNLGFVAELKNHFPPKDPHWYQDSYFIYHSLTNMFQAGLSNFAGIDTLATLKLANLLTALTLFICIALFITNDYVLPGLLIFVILLITSFAEEWTVFRAFHFHISNQAASTFYWSLPIFVTSLYVWQISDRLRHTLPMHHFALLVFAYAFTSYFAKGSFMSVFVALEFFSFIRFVVQKKVWQPSFFKLHIREFISFAFCPAFFALFAFLSQTNTTIAVFFGIETRDFANFNSWNPLLPLAAVYLPAALLLTISFRTLRAIRWDFLLCSLLNFFVFFVMKHEGYSDLYFAFNAILLNILFILSADIPRKLVNFFSAYLLCGFCLWYGVQADWIKGFTPMKISFENVYHTTTSNGTIPTEELEEYQTLSNKLPANALIAAPAQSAARFFLYSAFLQRRIWNECPIYAQNVLNVYVPERLFMASEKFLPDSLPPLPDNTRYYNATLVDRTTLQIDSSRYENPALRYMQYDSCVFSQLSADQCERIARGNQWTHIIVKTEDLVRINSYMKGLKRDGGKFITVFEL